MRLKHNPSEKITVRDANDATKMADHKYKLFRAIDPNKVTVPLNEKFSKLTLSSHKKRSQQRKREPQPDQEQQLPQEALAMRDNLETEQLDGSDYMDALQLSANTDVDVEQLSASVSHLTMHSKEEQQQQQQQQVSICISSTTEEEEDDAITISDTSEDEDQEQADPEPDSMAVSEREPEPAPQSILTSDKVQRIEAFLRDVERHVGDHTPPSSLASSSSSYSARRRSQIALADTESMTTPHTDEEDWKQPARPIDSSKRLADDDTVLDMDSSKRLADDATEANTLSSNSLEPESPEIKSISQRLAGNDTELNSTLQEEEEEDEPIPEESIEIPETGSEGEDEPEAEAEASPLRPSSSSSSSGNYETPSVQVSSINISAKINIKISIPTGYSSSGEEEEQEQEKEQEQAQRKLSSELVEIQEQKQLKQNQKSLISSSGDASEDEQFLSQAERLLNQLYGESWQTPDVIRTLKRSSGSGGGQRKPLKPRNLEATAATTTKKKRQPAATTTKKKERQPAQPNPKDESLLGDFSIFTRPLRTNQTPLNSTHLPPPPQPPLRAVQTERRPRHPPRARTNHVDEERWRALIDTESGTDASDDEDADATYYTDSESSSSDSGIKSRAKKAQDKDLTYLDLTKDEVEVISNPDEEEEDSQTPRIHRRLDDILRSCRATSKAKLPATPPPPAPAPQTTTRRQLFTPNAGYEDDNEAREIVAKALDLDMLDELENDYLPGTPVHKRLQEVKRNLGIVKPGETDLTKGKSIFDKATPKSSSRKKKEAVQVQKGNGGGKCSFLKSLEGQVSREKADNEAYFYRENFAKNKELLAQHLYKMFNAQVFNNELDVPLTWSKLLRNTAGRCMNKRKLNQRSSVVELSLKVLTTADRLRCTLIHELCHAAAWVFNGEGGHGRVWKMWAKRANDKFPDLPPIKVCHNYSIEFKYTYKCMSCNTSSHAHSRSRKVENLRCRLCRGPITLLLNKKDKQGNTVSTPAGEAKGFAKFVKENFQKFKQDHLTAAQVMRLLGVEYAKQKEGEAASIASRVQTLTLDD